MIQFASVSNVVLLRGFPEDPDSEALPQVAQGRDALVHTRGRAGRSPLRPGPLSIRAVFRGGVTYSAGETRACVTPGRFLVLNAGRTYRSTFDPRDRTESLAVLLSDRSARQAGAALWLPTAQLLDDPHAAPAGDREFVQHLHHDPERAWPRLESLRGHVATASAVCPAWLREQVDLLVLDVAAADHALRARADKLPSARAGTRAELLRRLCRARDFMECSLFAPIGVAEMALAADLSRFHFLRTFAAVFGETPARYQARRRLERAREFLLFTDDPVGRIGIRVGFEDFSAFVRAYRRQHGETPGATRQSRAAGAARDRGRLHAAHVP